VARRLGLTSRVLELPGLGLDIDAPDDLAAFVAENDDATETGRLLSRWLSEKGRAFLTAAPATPGSQP